MISDWLAFWDSRHFLYVNTRHKDVRYRLVAQAIAALVPSGEARVLDYGSGEALHANLVAEAAGELLLCEASAMLSGRRPGRRPTPGRCCDLAKPTAFSLPRCGGFFARCCRTTGGCARGLA
jgi:hypothetical protein